MDWGTTTIAGTAILRRGEACWGPLAEVVACGGVSDAAEIALQRPVEEKGLPESSRDGEDDLSIS